VLRYTLLRLLVLFGCLALLWLLGLRDQDELFLLVVGAALLSMAVSYVVLKPFREEYSREIAERLEARAAAKRARSGDERAEDAETGGADDGPAAYR
jgi:ABC-type bacteriocin/lantibiotic exporter with double-glycine peptidase domain